MHTKVLFYVLGLTAVVVPTMTTINAVDAAKHRSESKSEASVAEKLSVVIAARKRAGEAEASHKAASSEEGLALRAAALASREAECYAARLGSAGEAYHSSFHSARARTSAVAEYYAALDKERAAYSAAEAYAALIAEAASAADRAAAYAAKAETEYKAAELSVHVIPAISQIILSYI